MRMWTCVKRPGWKAGIIDDPDGNTIAEVYNHQEEKAQELVRMANCHKDLLEACRRAEVWIALATGRTEVHCTALQAQDDLAFLRAAIAKATPRE